MLSLCPFPSTTKLLLIFQNSFPTHQKILLVVSHHLHCHYSFSNCHVPYPRFSCLHLPHSSQSDLFKPQSRICHSTSSKLSMAFQCCIMACKGSQAWALTFFSTTLLHSHSFHSLLITRMLFPVLCRAGSFFPSCLHSNVLGSLKYGHLIIHAPSFISHITLFISFKASNL